MVVASPTSAWARALPPGQRVPLRVLREQVWLLREAGSGTREATDQGLLPHLRAYRRSIELGSSEAIKHVAAEGLGLACLSAWVVADAPGAGRRAPGACAASPPPCPGCYANAILSCTAKNRPHQRCWPLSIKPRCRPVCRDD